MTDTLYKLALLNLGHKDNHIFFTKDGELLYGRDENNLFYPHSLEMQGKFPPIFTEDLRQAFKLGMKVGSETAEQTSKAIPVPSCGDIEDLVWGVDIEGEI